MFVNNLKNYDVIFEQPLKTTFVLNNSDSRFIATRNNFGFLMKLTNQIAHERKSQNLESIIDQLGDRS